MKTSHWLLLILGLALGVLIGWWLFHTPMAPMPGTGTADTTSDITGQPMVTVTSGGLKFSAVRTGRQLAADEKGILRSVISLDVAVENLNDPTTPQILSQLSGGQVFSGGKALGLEVRNKVNDKRTLPAGLTSQVQENALIVSFLIEVSAGTQEKLPVRGQGYQFQFTYGPAGIPVELGPLFFP